MPNIGNRLAGASDADLSLLTLVQIERPYARKARSSLAAKSARATLIQRWSLKRDLAPDLSSER
jgi:hypothetical protein